jgi:hypothetical protein
MDDDKMDVDPPQEEFLEDESSGSRKKRKEAGSHSEDDVEAQDDHQNASLPNKKSKETEKPTVVGWVPWHNPTIDWPRIFVKTSAQQKFVSMAVPINFAKNQITTRDIKEAIETFHGMLILF